MGSGASKKAQNQIDYQGARAQNQLDQTRDWIVPQSQDLYNRFSMSADQQHQNYGDIYNRYSEFADTGGYSEGDIANMRARAVSPIRSIYSGARRELDRSRALQGGYSPGFDANLGRMAREQSYATSDAMTDVEAALAEMKQRGRLAGIGGMNQIYGTTPAAASTYGNMALQSSGQRLQHAGLQNQLGLGLIDAQIGNKGGGTDWGGILSSAGSLLGAFKPLIPGMGPKSPSNKKDDAKKTGEAGGGGSGVSFPEGYGNIFESPEFQDYQNNQQPKPGVETSTEFGGQSIQVNGPNGPVLAGEIPGTNPPLFMDEQNNIYDGQGNRIN